MYRERERYAAFIGPADWKHCKHWNILILLRLYYYVIAILLFYNHIIIIILLLLLLDPHVASKYVLKLTEFCWTCRTR